MFGEVICEIFGAFSPVDEKMPLFDAITDPIKSHVHGLGASLFDGVVANAGGACVVSLDGSGRLWMAHFFKGGAEHGCFFAVEEEGCEFSFGGGGKDGRHDARVDVDGAIAWWRRRVGGWGFERVGEWVAKEEIAAGARSRLLFGQVRGVAVDMEDHAAGVVAEHGVGMGGTVVEELRDCDCGGFGAICLCGGERSEGNKHGAVDGAGVV